MKLEALRLKIFEPQKIPFLKKNAPKKRVQSAVEISFKTFSVARTILAIDGFAILVNIGILTKFMKAKPVILVEFEVKNTLQR